MRFNKRGNEYLSPLLVLIVLIVFLWAAYALYEKINNTSPIGDVQYKLINTYDNAEKLFLYIDESAKHATYSSLNSLADNAGDTEDNLCGEYFGSTLLVSLNDTCLPEDDDVTRNFENYFQSSLLGYLSQYKTYNLNSKYDLWIDTENNLIKGASQNDVILPIGDVAVTDMKTPKEYIATPGNYFSSPSKSNLITSCFGYREAGVGASTYHEGIDFSTLNGKDVYSVADGIVVHSDKEAIEKNPNGCNCYGIVIISHGNGLLTSFMHLDSITVKQGDTVKKGDKIGIAGARYPGKRVNGAIHLHFEVISDKIKSIMVDPATNSPISYEYNYRGTPQGNYVINPACFFDLSQFTIDYNSKACSQIDATHKPSKKEDAPVKFCELYKQKGLSIPEKAEIPIQSTKIEPVKKEPIVTISNNDVPCSSVTSEQLKQKLKGTKYDVCSEYIDSISKYAKENKLDYSLVLLTSLVYGESGCVKSINRGGGFGLMQVTGVWKKTYPYAFNDNADDQIKAGLNILKTYTDDINKIKQGFDQNILLRLVLYGYNRGNHKEAASLMKNDGLSLMQAMTKACQLRYTGETCSGSSTPKNLCVNGKDSGKSMCTGPGLGANYPEYILRNYNDMCNIAGGTIGVEVGTTTIITAAGETKTVTYDSSSPSAVYGSIGSYTFTPSFKTEFDFNLTIYDEIFRTIRQLSDDYNKTDNSENQKKFIENILQKAKEISPSLGWQQSCDDEEDKALYSFSEDILYCANAAESSCYCEINIPKDISSKSGFKIEVDNNNDFILSNEYSEPIVLSNIKLGTPSSPLTLKNSIAVNVERKDADIYSIKATRFPIGTSLMYEIDATNPFYLLKSEGLIAFISETDYDKITSNKELKKCNVKKDTVKLCVKTNYRLPVYYENENTKSVEYERKDIRFAFTLKDVVPPPVAEIKSKYSPIFSEKENIIRWHQEVGDDDTEKFAVFYSKDDISELTYKELLDKADKKEFIAGDSEGVSSIDLENPSVEQSTTTRNIEVKYDITSLDKTQNKISLKNNILYMIDDENTQYYDYFLKLGFSSSEKYYLTIAALDKYNNVKMIDEERQRANLIIADIKDSLPPATMPIDGFSFSVSKNIDEKKITLDWSTPLKNIDGSSFDALKELKNYYVYYTKDNEEMTKDNFFSLSPIDISKDLHTYEFTNINLDKKSCFYVVPSDLTGNTQFNDKTKTLMGSNTFFSPVCV